MKIVTVLWEDQLVGQRPSFGPHSLLVSCVADELETSPFRLDRQYGVLISPRPMKGVGSLRRELQVNLRPLANRGRVFAVVDRDRVRDLWRNSLPLPNDCKSSILQRFFQEAPGPYELVLLERNIETLVVLACEILRLPVPTSKPRPDERDRLLNRVAHGVVSDRRAIRDRCPSFDRLVNKVTAELHPLFAASP